MGTDAMHDLTTYRAGGVRKEKEELWKQRMNWVGVNPYLSLRADAADWSPAV